MKHIAIVTASHNRYRAGIHFPARQKTPVDLTGPDDPRLEKWEADPVLTLTVKEVEETTQTEDGNKDSNSTAEYSDDEKLALLKGLLEEAEEKPKVADVSKALGFKVSGDQVTSAWNELNPKN